MRYTVLVVIFLVLACGAQGEPIPFRWPAVPEAPPVADARVRDAILEANEAAADAARMSEQVLQGEAAALAAAGDPGAITETVADGMIFSGQIYHNGAFSNALAVGQMTAASGSKMIGEYQFINYPSLATWGHAVAYPRPTSLVQRFSGSLYLTKLSTPLFAEGVTEYRNGERFVGSYYLWFGPGAKGVFHNADGSKKFTGTMSEDEGVLVPRQGVVTDMQDRLLAVVNKGP